MTLNKKNIGITLGIILVLVALIVISSVITPKGENNSLSEDAKSIYDNAVKESESITANERKDYIEIDMNIYLEKYKQEEASFVLVGRDSCQYCQIAEPILQKISKEYNFDIYYLNTDHFTQEDKEMLLDSNEFFEGGFGTPLVLLIEKETIKAHVDGLLDYSNYVAFLKEYSFIKE